MRLVVTGATGFVGWRATTLLRERGHDIVAVARPDARPRRFSRDLDVERVDVGDPHVGPLLRGADAVLHFAGVPDPTSARVDPARAVRENAGTTLNLLERCAEEDTALVYPSTVRAVVEPPPDAYALSKRLGEEVCRLHHAPALVLRLTSIFGPGQVAAEGATGAIASFAARALAREAIVIDGDPSRTRDFVYVDDIVLAIERLVEQGRWDETLTIASGVATPLLHAAELVREAVGSPVPVQTPGGDLPPGENSSYAAPTDGSHVALDVRSLEEAIPLYVDWLRGYSASQSST